MAQISTAQAGSDDVVFLLDTIAWTEGTGASPVTVANGYDVIVDGVGGTHEIFSDFTGHPFLFPQARPAKLIVAPGTRFPNGLRSSASGRYQFIVPTWKALQAQLKLPDFSPLSQDLAAIELFRQRGALAHLENGDIDKAIAAHFAPVDLEDAISEDANIWASLPGNGYGQGGKSMAEVVSYFETLAVSVQV